MRKNVFLVSTLACTLLSSCIDDSYSVADMDTTVGISVKNLTIPLKVDNLEMEQVLDLEEDSKIKKYELNGEMIYAIMEEGTFESDAIEIPGFTAEGADIAPIEQLLKKEGGERNYRTNSTKNQEEAPIGYYPIGDFNTSFSFSGDVDAAVKDIQRIAVKTSYAMDLDVSATLAAIKDITKIGFENLKAKLPKGLEGTMIISVHQNGAMVTYDITDKYDKYTGILTDIPQSVLSTDNGQLNSRFDITGIDLTVNVSKNAQGMNKQDEKYANELVFENGKFDFNGNILVEEGEVAVYSNNKELTLDDIPDEIEYTCTPKLEEIIVEQVSGDVEYAIDGIDIDPVSLKDIPDVLGQEGTNIELANPQIYLSLNNPLAKNNLRAEAELNLTAKRDKGEAKSIESGILTIDKAENVFCLTPNINMTQAEMHKDFQNAQKHEFKDFDAILSGNGLPKEILIDVKNPQIPRQTITDFELGQNIEKIKGKYLFFAPLALKDANSIVAYKDTLDGWNDETLNKLEIETLNLKADIKSEIPLSVAVKIIPIDAKGKAIQGVTSDVLELEVSEQSQAIDMNIVGKIKNLDGVIIDAKLRGHNGEVLAPDQKLILNNLKIAVTGLYIDKF